MKLRAISLHQPWASLVGQGKSIETRGWNTDYRGPLAIHAAKTWTPEHYVTLLERPFCDALTRAGFDLLDPAAERGANVLPLGAIVAVCRLADCLPIWSGVHVEDCPEGHLNFMELGAEEVWFGNYSTGRFAWMLENIHLLPTPIPMRGRQRFWTVELPVAALFATKEAT